MKFFLKSNVNYWFVLLLFIGVTPYVFADNYIVTPNETDSLRAVVTLTLNHPLEMKTTFKPRSVGGVESTIDVVECTHPHREFAIKLNQSDWELPEACSKLSWSISFQQIGNQAYDLSNQESRYHPKGWWFLNESGSLLRYRDQAESSVCAHVAGLEKCTFLPPLNRAPMFLMFGESEQVFDWNGKSIEIYTGYDAKYLGLDQLLLAFKLGLEKITAMTTTGVAQDKSSAPLQFVWLGISSDHGSMGGAAGSRAFLSNFRIGGATVPEIEKTRLLIVSGHEYMHLIGISAGASWVTETLAAYYGFKAFSSRSFALEAFEQMAYIDQPDAPLIVRGAALWRDLDAEIIQATNDAESLDNFLPLFATTFESQSSLPIEFIIAVAEKIGQSRFDKIVSAYF